jgi:hypothetical protein
MSQFGFECHIHTYRKPVLHYGCEALVTATPAILNKLEVIQNEALQLITKPGKSTPQASLQVLTVNNPSN